MTKKEKINYLTKKLAEKKINSSKDFLKLKQKFSGKLNIFMPSNSKILNIYKLLLKKNKINKNQWFESYLKKRPIRSLSGVVVISVLTKPWPCPGKCVYCPLEKGIPKSYLSGEPAVERAKLLKFDPYLQVKKRIETLEKNGHPTDKIELIVIGGTWSYLPKRYQTWFIKRCFEGANQPPFSHNTSHLKNTWLKKKKQTLKNAQKINENAKHRIIGLTLETRPDYITPEEIKRMRKLGCTRVEIGVQILDDKILKKNRRGHKVEAVIRATKLLKNAGIKICYHIMPGLLGSNPKIDLAKFKKIFSDQNFRPDMLKIYPCVVTKGSELYKLWKEGKYIPYTDSQLINLLIKMKQIVPPYIRINRVIRDIPSFQIEAGNKISNLREVVQKEMKKRGLSCQCIRCREIKNLKINIKNLTLIKREYEASGGKEIFLSYENQKRNKLVAFLRLRLLPQKEKLAIKDLQGAAIIREIHTYGQLIPIGEKSKAEQHLGLGKKLINQAEKIAKQFGYKKMAVISGVGVRNYYRKFGYRLKNTYMMKNL